MKQFKTLVTMTLLAVIVASCSVSQNTVGGGVFQKRKYTKGFYFNRHSNGKATSSDESSVLRKEEKEEVAQQRQEVKAPITATNHSVSADVNQVKQEQVAAVNEQKSGSKPAEKAVVRKKRSEIPAKKDDSKESSNERNGIAPLKQKSVIADKKRSNSHQSSSSDDMFILAVIFAILIPPVGVAIYTSIDWTKVLICLLLTILFFLPGMIYALLVVFDVI